MLTAQFSGLTDVGLLRDHNEDTFVVMPEYRMAAVADGMGGHRSGDVASQLAVKTLDQFFVHNANGDATWPFPANPELSEEENYLLTGIQLANRSIFDRAQKASRHHGMGTTVVAVLLDASYGHITVGHVGDSRCYRIRDGKILQLTRDHSLISDASQIAPWMTEEELKQIPSNVITRALGIREETLVDLVSLETRSGDLYLLCSDGLSGPVTDDEILEITTSDYSIENMCKSLIDRANASGGPDNITAVIIRLDEQM